MEKKSWKYICVRGLGFVPGLCCPHHDSTQSNGVLRADDFDGMLQRQRRRSSSRSRPRRRENAAEDGSDADAGAEDEDGELGVCIDDQAALVIDGDAFRVIATETASATTAVRTKRVMKHSATAATSSGATVAADGVAVREDNIREHLFLPSATFRPLSLLLN